MTKNWTLTTNWTLVQCKSVDNTKLGQYKIGEWQQIWKVTTNLVNENKHGRYQTRNITKNLDNGKKLDSDNNWTMTTDLDNGKQGSLN
jgi:hypothetical protein